MVGERRFSYDIRGGEVCVGEDCAAGQGGPLTTASPAAPQGLSLRGRAASRPGWPCVQHGAGR